MKTNTILFAEVFQDESHSLTNCLPKALNGNSKPHDIFSASKRKKPTKVYKSYLNSINLTFLSQRSRELVCTSFHEDYSNRKIKKIINHKTKK